MGNGFTNIEELVYAVPPEGLALNKNHGSTQDGTTPEFIRGLLSNAFSAANPHRFEKLANTGISQDRARNAFADENLTREELVGFMAANGTFDEKTKTIPVTPEELAEMAGIMGGMGLKIDPAALEEMIPGLARFEKRVDQVGLGVQKILREAVAAKSEDLASSGAGRTPDPAPGMSLRTPGF